LKEAFYNFDTDHDGFLTIEELRHICTNISDPLPADEMEQFIQEAGIFIEIIL
jgi:Ca2+-binding EF-hand superfamily protein